MKDLRELSDFELNIILHTLCFHISKLDDKESFKEEIRNIFHDDFLICRSSVVDILTVADFLKKRGYKVGSTRSQLRIFVDGKGFGIFYTELSEERKYWAKKDGCEIIEMEDGYAVFELSVSF